ncbi:uncharacterized protein LOC134565100 isoform X2 [Prinia subflava]|uniref:uncharacterized protein LOC134565100 isoform X2 n=1 Tax=Prinia subflava TaxID=208062 RepID=UPI002FE3259F
MVCCQDFSLNLLAQLMTGQKDQPTSTEWMVITVDLSNISQDLTVYDMGLDKKTYLPLNPMMNPIQVVILLMLNSLVAAWIVPQPRQNVWVTLAQTLQQENICLSTAAAKNPMSTCLVGIPLQAGEFPASLDKYKSNEVPEAHTPQPHKDHQKQDVFAMNPLAEWVRGLPKVAHEPQELELLGSSPATYCIHFSVIPKPTSTDEYHLIRQFRGEFTAKRWCHNISHIAADNPSHSSPRSLPKGLFLVCGDRAWAGIPLRLLGGPCTVGRLSVLTPNQTLIREWTHKNKSADKIQKRSADNLDPNCNSEIFHWAKSKRVAVSLFLPWVAAAKALGELGHLECWVVKQANLTSIAISSLLEDEEITRQATIQNRAAFDYLLLLHGHECQEFEGLCCMNLSSKAPNIHAALRSMNNMIGQVKQESEDWIKELFKGWGFTGWWISVVKKILLLFVILFLVTIAFGILRCLIFKAINSLIPSTSEVNHIELANLK